MENKILKANELRIGNFINKNEQVVEITKRIIFVKPMGKDNMSIYRDFQLKPIPLTEQWLKDLGFKNVNLNAWRIKGLPDFELINDIFYSPDHLLMWFPEIKYIHQLQNIYQSLTGKELIKK